MKNNVVIICSIAVLGLVVISSIALFLAASNRSNTLVEVLENNKESFQEVALTALNDEVNLVVLEQDAIVAINGWFFDESTLEWLTCIGFGCQEEFVDRLSGVEEVYSVEGVDKKQIEQYADFMIEHDLESIAVASENVENNGVYFNSNQHALRYRIDSENLLVADPNIFNIQVIDDQWEFFVRDWN
ncbi:MAG: hypothetical protein O3B64_02715 [bacterium]|nr:hypothetical protein [bacterium]